MNLKPWRQVAEPHADVMSGKFTQAEYAADLSRVHAGTAHDEYQNAAMFYQRTFITEGMGLLLDSVIRRLAGKGGDPVIQLQTAFGGGKTHTMLAVYHLARGATPASELQGIPALLDAAGVTELPAARIAVLDGVELLGMASKPREHGHVTVHTLWGELAWQLGGEAAYAHVKTADETGTAPGKTELTQMLAACAPCVILMDELVRYVSQFEEGKALSGGTFNTQLSFVQSLTEALKAVPTAVLLASLPHSEREAGSDKGVQALRSLEHYFGRVQAVWKPVATEEAFEIVRRRLFANINDTQAKESVCRAFADCYQDNGTDLPQETQDSKYLERLMHAYPIHPEVFDRLYEDWSTLENFQRTRGVLKLMAKVIHRLWKDGNNDALIMPGNLPLMDADTRTEVLYYLPQGWDPVIERDVDGDRSETWEIENSDTRLGSVQACRRTARTIFLGSAPGSSSGGQPTQHVRGVELERVLLGVIQPGQQPGVYKDALRRLGDRLHYLNHADNRFWLDTRPNLRREMEERKRRFEDHDDVFPLLEKRIRHSLTASLFKGIHVFTPGADVPDDWALRLVVLPPDAAFSRNGRSLATECAGQILQKRGESPRFKQNRLLFVAADFDSVSRLKDHVRSYLAWNSIVRDYNENLIVLDNLLAKQAADSARRAEDTVRRMIRETYRWLLVPEQHAQPGGKGVSELAWEHFALNPSAANWGQEIERVLKENELAITEWSPVHLSRELKAWFWNDEKKDVPALEVWQKSCQYLFLPRLKDDEVFRHTLAAGAVSRDFFGLALGKEEGRYVGFSYGRQTTPMLDALLLIEPVAAAEVAEQIRLAEEEAKRAREAQNPAVPTAQEGGLAGGYPADTVGSTGIAGGAVSTGGSGAPSGDPNPGTGGAEAGGSVTGAGGTPKLVKKRFYGRVNINPFKAKMQFNEVVDEVVRLFAEQTMAKVTITIEIDAEREAGFNEALVRAVKENCNTLEFGSAEFEEGE